MRTVPVEVDELDELLPSSSAAALRTTNGCGIDALWLGGVIIEHRLSDHLQIDVSVSVARLEQLGLSSE